MGFFDLKADCAICSKQVGLLRFQIANKEWVCPECFKKCGFTAMTPIKKMTASQVQAVLQEKEKSSNALKTFVATKKIGSYLEIDENKKQWLIPDGFFGGKKKPKIYNFTDVIDFELLEDGSSITKGGLGRAVAGGILFGGVGAVVGGVTGSKKSKATCDSLKIRITLNSIATPTTYINFIKTPTKKSSFVYKTDFTLAQECLSVLQVMCSESSGQDHSLPDSKSGTSEADEILKFKQLLDNGVITQEEFEMKKKQILGL
ncbi:SHOCT domain-containing protein [Bacillus sp. FSL W7-1360]